MHLLLPFASVAGDAAAPAMASLKLPNLERLLSRLAPVPPASGEPAGSDAA